MQINQIDGDTLRKMIVFAASNLEKRKDYIDRLNVFPVPDGDTGTNMSLTLLAAARELAKIHEVNIINICKVLKDASLRGARGNSGVILSQLIRGFARHIIECNQINSTNIAAAYKAGVDTAYRSVMRPTEGTILTVAREGADEAIKLSRQTDNIVSIFEGVLKHSKKVLDKTPQMLTVLKEAGVVDAGGMGLVIALEGALNALLGKEVNNSYNIWDEINETEKKAGQDIRYKYCTEFIIIKNKDIFSNNITDKFKIDLEYEGDSLMVIDDDEIIKVHIHTNNPGKIIQDALNIGDIDDIKIENMKVQSIKYEQNNEAKEFGFVSIAKGQGIINIFNDLHVDKVIEGGQTMNPSIADILKAVSEINAENVFILPNNKNIILAANQVKDISNKNIFVVKSRNIPEGIIALMNFDYNLSSQENYDKICKGLESVKTASITYSVRDSVFNGNKIKAGDLIGIQNDEIKYIGDDINQICFKLLEDLVDQDSEIITLYFGDEVNKSEAEKLAVIIENKYPDSDIELYEGGQPLYYYYLSVE